MKRIIKLIVIAALLLCTVPETAIICRSIRSRPDTDSTSAMTSGHAEPKTSKDLTIMHISDGSCETMSISDYCVYSVLAEVPSADIPDEVLKAMTAAARTYAVRRSLIRENEELAYDMTDDPSECRVCLSPDAAAAIFGSDTADLIRRVKAAEQATAGTVILYGSEPIITPIHTANGGITESAFALWGTDIPYLTAVESTGDLTSEYYEKEYSFTSDELSARISAYCSESCRITSAAINNATASGTVLDISFTPSEGETVILTGEETARIFSLPSAMFTLTHENDCFSFTVNGCGHGAGMSISGAEQMAESGASWQDIITHYYCGTRISPVIFE